MSDRFFRRALLWTLVVGALLVSALLYGCSAPAYGLVKKREVQTTQVQWVRADPVLCNGRSDAYGCAARLAGLCVVTMPQDAPDFVVAEEFRHCFGEDDE